MYAFFILFSTFIFSRAFSSGIVDENGTPLPGVTVVEENTANGIISNLDGNYVLTTRSPESSLTISYLGFDTQTIAVNGRRYLDIILNEMSKVLRKFKSLPFKNKRKTV